MNPKLCECGCGGIPTVAKKSYHKTGTVAGQPNRFILGHWGRIAGSHDHLRKRPYEHMYNLVLKTSRERGLDSNISYEDYISFVNKQCFYCSDILVWHQHVHSKKEKRSAHNLDRKDSSIGYSKDNCVACCGLCNMTKGNRYSHEEFVLLGETIRRIRELRNEKNNRQSKAAVA